MLLRSRLNLQKQQLIVFEAAKASRSSSAVRFCSGPAELSKKMDEGQEQQKPPYTTGNIMSDSFGHEYATRSDEEGFGGIYGSNQSLKRNEDDENNPIISEQNGSHGKEVKQEESSKDS